MREEGGRKRKRSSATGEEVEARAAGTHISSGEDTLDVGAVLL